MKVKIKETRILTLEVQSVSVATKEQVEKEIRNQLATLDLERTSFVPAGGGFNLLRAGAGEDGNHLARCEVREEPKTESREILSVEP